MSNQEFVAIKDLKMGMKNINAVFIVLEISPAIVTKEGREVRTMRVADASASVNVSVWDAAGAMLSPGDIVRITRGYTNLWRFALTLYSGKQGDLQKVGEFCMLFNEQVNMSEPIPPSPPGPPAPPAPAAAPPTPPATPAATPAATAAAAPNTAAAPNNNNKHKTYARPRHPHQRNNNRR